MNLDRFNNLKVGHKFLVSSLLLVMLGVIMGGLALYGFGAMRASQKSIYENSMVRMAHIAQIQNLMNQNLREMLVAANIGSVNTAYAKRIEKNVTEITRLWAAFTANALTQDERVLADEYTTKRKEFVEKGLRGAIKVLADSNGNSDETAAYIVEFTIPLYKDAVEVFDKLSALQHEAAKVEMADSDRFAHIYMLLMVGMAVLGALGLMISLWISRRVTQPLARAVQVVDQVARGDLTVSVGIRGRDEVGQVSESLDYMVSKLRDIIGKVQVNTEQVSAEAEALAEASRDLSNGAAEQASSTEEASATVEEMAANIRQSASNAQQTSKISVKAVDGARHANDAVAQAVVAMETIAEKIGIVQEIARQTDLLALNAAIESARAGEHGRGFSVVASEVRKLAERSQHAAREINELTVSSVEVAEKAGRLLNEMLPDIQRTTDLVREIHAASSEQNAGAEEIARALQGLDGVTQKNASAAEQMAATSQDMASQSAAAQEAVAYFHLGSISAGGAPLNSSKGLLVPDRTKLTNTVRP